jgi:hypothetical protein
MFHLYNFLNISKQIIPSFSIRFIFSGTKGFFNLSLIILQNQNRVINKKVIKVKIWSNYPVLIAMFIGQLQFVFNEMQTNEYDITNELGEREYRFDGQQPLILFCKMIYKI